MPETTSHAPGTPSWTDLASPDVGAAKEFYAGLFGWEAVPAGPVEQTGGYHLFHLRGRPVAGVAPIMQDGQMPVWTTYISVDDADDTARKAVAAGATPVIEPMDVMTAGRMAGFIDPTGAFTGIWQPGDHTGAGIVNEPGSMVWNELTCRDTEAAIAFYGSVFGWEAAADPPYTMWRADGREIGGMMAMDERWPEDLPSHWMVYFGVDDTDTDAAAARARELGGSVPVAPCDIPPGRFAVLADPAGAHFSVITLAAEAAAIAPDGGVSPPA